MPCHAGQVMKCDYKLLVDRLGDQRPVADEFCPEIRQQVRKAWYWKRDVGFECEWYQGLGMCQCGKFYSAAMKIEYYISQV